MRAPTRLRFDGQYQEPAVLDDGTRTMLRLHRPGDEELIRRNFSYLSPEALAHRNIGLDHFAILAMLPRPERREEVVGLGRGIALPSDPTVFEGYVATLGRLQRRGLGRILVRKILAAAAERGSGRVRFRMRESDAAMQAILQKIGPIGVSFGGDGTLTIEVKLRSPRPPWR
jgi:ribosomal protein S18 acetylase RimI-like enzyme